MINAIILDDDQCAAGELKKMIESYHADIEIEAVCHNLKEIELALKGHHPDLVFMDIELGKSQTSLDLLKKISPINFEIIFTTSFNEYAVQAIKLSAIDYLLKPIDEVELKTAIEKFREKKTRNNSDRIHSLLVAWANPGNQQNKIPLPTLTGYDLITIADIIYFEVANDQTILIMNDGRNVVVTMTLKECEDLLTPCRFFRIHKSFLINLNHVKKYIKGKDGTVVMSNDAHLTVSRNIKEKFIENLRLI